MTRTISILGELSVVVDETVVPITSRKQRELLAALAIRRGASRSADALVQELWGDDAGAAARKNLHVLIGRLRAALSSGSAVRLDANGYALPDSEWEFAEAVFERELQQAQRLAASEQWPDVAALLDIALGRWEGAALGTLAGESWARAHARALDADRRAAMILRIEAWLRTGRSEQALVELRQLTRESRDDHVLHGQLVRALYGAGRQAEALEECRAALTRARASGNTSNVERFRRLERDLLVQEHDFAARRGPALPRVPVPRHVLVGRVNEHAAVRDRLLNGCRLTTIVGPGGTGKTRLATDVSLALSDELDDVAWIDLSPATSTDDVLATLLTAFGITSADDDPVNALVHAIGTRAICLVLDNFEQVAQSASLVARIRDACPSARLLVTSRVALGVDYEDIVQLGPFALVEDVEVVRVDALERLDAVRLFHDRAELVDGVVPTSDETIRDVHRICAKVDGLPLGIELAAARTRLLTPREILVQLDRTFAFIASRSDEHPERHRSMDSVIAWSYDLLDSEEKRAFRTLSLFAGGCVSDDFAHVAGFDDADVARTMLARLTAHSLAVRVGPDGHEERWRMLETIAAFGRRMLVNDPNGSALRDRFARRMLQHAQASNTYGSDARISERRFIEERANVHAAFDWAVEEVPERAADIFIAMDRYLHTRGSIFEGDELGARLRAVVHDLDETRRAFVLGLAGRMAHYRGDASRGSDLLLTSLEIARAIDDDHVIRKVWIWYVEGLRNHGDVALEHVVEEADEVRAYARAHGDAWTAALATAQIGFALMDLEQAPDALQKYREAKETFESLGDDFWVENMEANLLALGLIESRDPRHLIGLTECANRLAELEYWTYSAHVESFRMRCALELERFADAAAWADDLIPRVRATGEAILLMFALACSSIAYLEQGRIEDARSAAWESLEIAVRSSQTLFADYSFAILACSLREIDETLARWIAHAVDRKRLDGIYALDRFVLARLTSTFGPLDEKESMRLYGDRTLIDRLELVARRIEASGIAPAS